MSRAVGIDLGTTNSVAAVLELGTPVIVPNSEGGRLTPSVVAFTASGDVLVGDVARRQTVTNPERTFRSVKRHMGSSWTTGDIDGRRYTPQEISARILTKVSSDTADHVGVPVTRAVVTVPAYFDEGQRTATKEACRIAGLEVLRLINEPTAAALAFGLDRAPDPLTVLVFDLGGGTLDVSVLTIADGRFDVRASQGDTRLGGDDWDERLVALLLARFVERSGFDPSGDIVAMHRLREAAEQAKVELSTVTQTRVSLPFLVLDGETAVHLDEVVTRTEFETVTADLLDRCSGPLTRAVADAGVAPGRLDRVLLVGGSTRMPAVRALVTRLTGREPSAGPHPEEAVALGAAVHAGMLNHELDGLQLLDVTPLSLGLETRGGVVTRLVDRNTTIPHRVTKVFTTAEDDQTQVEIHVLQGERTLASANTSLGKFHLTGLLPAPRRVPQVEVTFDIDADGIVTVSARDRATRRQQRVVITGRNALSEEQIARMVRDAERHADADRRLREELDLRYEVEAALRHSHRLLTDAQHVWSPTERERFLTETDRLRVALDDGDVDELHRMWQVFSVTAQRYAGWPTPAR